MNTEINESKILTKHMTCKCKCKFDGKRCNSNQKQNNDKCRCQCEKHHTCEKIWNPATCNSKNGKYLSSFIGDSVIVRHEIIEETKTIPTHFNEKSSLLNTKFTYFNCILLITIALLIAVSN